jgi:hypothetical protein
MDWIPYGEARFYRVDLSDVRVIMVIMYIPVVGLLCKEATRRIPLLKYFCQVCVGACGYVLSCQTLNIVTSRGSGYSGAYPALGSPWPLLPGARACTELGYEGDL